ncbi:MAG: alpha/beta fold hydrolase [Devosia sp.]
MTQDLLLLPGLGCDALVWRDVLARLEGVAATVADLSQDDTIAAMARRTLAAAPPRFSLAGHSMGGYVCLEIMRQAPERVERLALLDSAAAPDTPERSVGRRAAIAAAQGGKFALVAEAALPGLVTANNVKGPIGRELREMMIRVGQQTFERQQHAIISRPDSRPDLAGFDLPVLVGVGEFDTLIPPAMSEEMAAAIAGAVLAVFADAAHSAPMENPGAVAAAMQRWLAR